VFNVHLKSKIPTDIPGQKVDGFTWRSVDGWAEGSFLLSMKRMSQALADRRLVDQILDADRDTRIVVAGDFYAAPVEVCVARIDIAGDSGPAGHLRFKRSAPWLSIERVFRVVTVTRWCCVEMEPGLVRFFIAR